MLVLQYICMTPRNTWFRIAEQKNLRKKAEKSSLKNCSILAQNIYHVVYKKKMIKWEKTKSSQAFCSMINATSKSFDAKESIY